jgi:hypothetical protein
MASSLVISHEIWDENAFPLSGYGCLELKNKPLFALTGRKASDN